MMFFGFLGSVPAVTLTQRQKQFLERLRQIHRRLREPVPYGELARSFGISKWAAYDMMETLEQKGLVRREYVLRGKRPRGGRSRVAFRPATGARAAVAPGPQSERVPAARERREWDRTRRRILRDLTQMDEGARASILNRLLAAIPRERAKLAYCGELLTALLLRVSARGEHARHVALLRAVSERVSRTQGKLVVLAGLSGGLSLHGEDENGLANRFALYVRRYERYVREMSAGHRRALLTFFHEVVQRLSPDCA
jgi:predicted transcriptional regulator